LTGSVDRVGSLIRSYRNDALPKIAVTVDLLTTGIDVPSRLLVEGGAVDNQLLMAETGRENALPNGHRWS